jgi:hypothetical protein
VVYKNFAEDSKTEGRRCETVTDTRDVGWIGPEKDLDMTKSRWWFKRTLLKIPTLKAAASGRSQRSETSDGPGKRGIFRNI